VQGADFCIPLFGDFECGSAFIALINCYVEEGVFYFFVWFSNFFSAVWAIDHSKHQASAFYK